MRLFEWVFCTYHYRGNSVIFNIQVSWYASKMRFCTSTRAGYDVRVVNFLRQTRYVGISRRRDDHQLLSSRFFSRVKSTFERWPRRKSMISGKSIGYKQWVREKERERVIETQRVWRLSEREKKERVRGRVFGRIIHHRQTFVRTGTRITHYIHIRHL